MSSTNRGSIREPYDDYTTDPWIVERFLEVHQELPIGAGCRWIEPCAGSGNIIRTVNALPRPTPVWTAVEIQPKYRRRLVQVVKASNVRIENFLTAKFEEGFDVAITNPPYSQAYKVIQKSLKIADWVVMLLRVNWLGSGARHRFLSTFMPDVFVLPNRPSFRMEGGTDSTEYSWMVWGPPPRKRSEGKVTILSTTPKEVRLRKVAH